MAYKVINDFRDGEDGKRLYRAGDPYPREGLKPTKKRLSELSKKHQEHKVAFIEEVKEEE